MSKFAGQYEGKIDAKGRLVLPSRLKSNMPAGDDNNTLVISKGFEPCIVLYTVPEWEKTYSIVANLDEFNKEYRSLQRNLFSRITYADLDNNGRFLLPKGFMQHAELEKDVLFIGMVNRIELWDPEKYEQHLQDPDELAEKAQKYVAANQRNNIL